MKKNRNIKKNLKSADTLCSGNNLLPYHILMLEVTNTWYRISVKWIIYSEEGKVLLCKEEDGTRDLPWWGLDWWEDPIKCLERELDEEMWLIATDISTKPVEFIAIKKPTSQKRPWISNICYKVTLKNLDFKTSDECIEIWFFDLSNIESMNVFPNVTAVFKKLF